MRSKFGLEAGFIELERQCWMWEQRVKQEQRGEQGEVCGGAEVQRREMEAVAVEEKEDGSGDGAGCGKRPRRWMQPVEAESRCQEVADEREGGDAGDVADGQAGDGAGRGGGEVECGVFPVVDEETVQAAEEGEECCRGKEVGAKLRSAGDGGDEDGGREEEADGDLLGEAVGAAGGVDKDEVSGEERAENEVEANGVGVEAGDKESECDRGGEDAQEEERAVAVVEAMAMQEIASVERTGIEKAGVEQTVGCIEHPDGDGHGGGGDEWKRDVDGGGEEPGPEDGDGGGVERKQMPEGEGAGDAAFRAGGVGKGKGREDGHRRLDATRGAFLAAELARTESWPPRYLDTPADPDYM